MPITEIIAGSLLQADADTRIFEKLEQRWRVPAMVVDLRGVEGLGNQSDARFTYVRWAIEDGPLPDTRTLATIEIAAVHFIEAGGVVVSMCEMGRNRSGLLSALIVARLRRISGSEAMRFVRSKVPEALTNEVFEAYLERKI